MQERDRTPPPLLRSPGLLALIGACALALMPAVAAGQSPLRPPAEPLLWAGLIGLLVGADGARPRPRWAALRLARAIAHVAAWLIGAALLAASAGAALPPSGLLQQDLAALIERARLAQSPPELAPGDPPPTIPPPPRTPTFIGSSAARLAGDLSLAPSAGERGARLLIGVGGAMLTWAGALALGRALRSGRGGLGATLPLLLALAAVAIPGGEGGAPLAIGLLAAVVCGAASSFARREQRWDAAAIDYSDELRRDVTVWGALLVGTAMLFGWALPLWPGNPLARALSQLGGVPSGVAALDRGAQRSSGETLAEVGLSTLPSVELGSSLALGPPDQPALRVRFPGGGPPEGGLRYYRMRALNRYGGIMWSAEARVSSEPAADTQAVVAGAVVQEIEDLRPDKQLIVGLPDILAISIPARYERFADGGLAAVAGEPPERRYTVLSRPQELAPVAQADRQPPDLTPYLVLPRSLPPRVGELGAAIVAGQQGPTARALAIERYLRELPYTYEVAPARRGGDAVDQFLFEMRSGYCTYYASAMVVLARGQGIPARLAVGYAPGDLQADGSVLVLEADAHAWPELWIDGRWVPFEPTPIMALPERGGGRSPQVVDAPEAVAPSYPTWLWPALALALAVLAGGGALWLRRGAAPPLGALDLASAELERASARHGVTWPAGATLRELSALIAARARPLAPLAAQLVALIERGRYSGRALSDAEQRELARLRDEARERARADREGG